MVLLAKVQEALKNRVKISRPCVQRTNNACGHWTVFGVNEHAFIFVEARLRVCFSLMTVLHKLNFLIKPTGFLQHSNIKTSQ